MPVLFVFAGLPGSGKSTVARALARRVDACWIRIDSLEQAIVDASVLRGTVEDAGYRAGYALAADNLPLGQSVVADSVNPLMLTRDAWREVGLRAGARVVEIEIVCGDTVEHRRRVETRLGEVANLNLPSWAAVAERHYERWTREPLRIDTFDRSVEACIAEIIGSL